MDNHIKVWRIYKQVNFQCSIFMLNTGLFSAFILLTGVVSTAALLFVIIVNGIIAVFSLEPQKLKIIKSWKWLFILAALLTVIHTGSKLIGRFFN